MRLNPLFTMILLLSIIPAWSSCKEPTPPPETPEKEAVDEGEDEATPVAGEDQDEATPSEEEAKGPVTKPDYDGPGPYDCEDAANCTKTCGGGVLNRLWFHAHKDQVPMCKDGCAGKSTGKPICVDGECVATDRDGNVVDHCTKKLDKSAY